MKIERLELEAFGPFTDEVIDFSAPLPGLHVVYGPNEAGKSSSMRALKALLFGFPRSGDNFLHSYDRMVIGGELSHSDGTRLSFRRRKRAGGGLFDAADAPLPSSALEPFLHGLDEGVFLALYGIDHERLVAGGRDILDQHGEAGRALYAAGAGMASMKRLMEILEKEASELFRPQGSTRALNVALAEHARLKKELREASLAPADWEARRRSLEEAIARLGRLIAEQERVEHEKTRLSRIRDLSADLAERRAVLERIAGAGAIVRLPEAFRERWVEVCSSLARASEGLEKARLDREAQQAALGRLDHDPALLARAAAIESLNQRLGQYRKGAIDRPGLERQRRSELSDAASLLQNIRPDLSLEGSASLAPVLLKKSAVSHLATRHEALQAELRKAESSLADTDAELGRLSRLLAGLPEPFLEAPVREAVAAAFRSGDLDERIDEADEALRDLRQQAELMRSRLPLWQGTLEGVRSLSLPMEESVAAFGQEFDLIRERLAELRSRMDALRDRRNAAIEELRHLELADELPSGELLGEVRQRREDGWRLLCRQWIDGEDVREDSLLYDSDHPLHEAYARMVAVSDSVADRLWREADRVQKARLLKDSVASSDEALGGLSLEHELEMRRSDELGTRWVALWAPIGIGEPLKPLEMRSWMASFARLQGSVEEVLRMERDVGRMRARRQALVEGLQRALAASWAGGGWPCGEGELLLASALGHARAVLDQAENARRERETIQTRYDERCRQREDEERRVQEARGAFERWAVAWATLTAPLGLGEGAHPFEAISFLESLQGCFEHLKAAEALGLRIAGIDRDAGDFTAALADLCEGLEGLPRMDDPEQAVSLLRTRLDAARHSLALKEAIGERIASIALDSARFSSALSLAEQEKARLMAVAGAVDEDGVDAAMQCFESFSSLERRLHELEALLVRNGGGVPLSALEEEAAAVDIDALPGRIQALGDDLELRLKPEVGGLQEQIGLLKGELRHMDGKGTAADLADALQQSTAAIRRMSSRYLRLRLAVSVLQEEAERYRSENQGPLLERASACFRALTLGSFDGLRADLDEKGAFVILGVRPGSKGWIGVEAMSSGTRDQLYLALRLATLAWRLEGTGGMEPMPFIVDDILVNFDDERSLATLRLLEGLADRVQVIMFTHQDAVRQMAVGMAAGSRVFVHALGSGEGGR